MNQRIRVITFGAVAVALFVGMYAVLAINDEIIQEALGIASIIPLALYVRQFKLKAGIIACLSAILLSMFLVQPTILIVYAIPSAIIALVFGVLLVKTDMLIAGAGLAILNFVRLIYELCITSLLLNTDIKAEYGEIITQVTSFVCGTATTGNAYLLIHDMTLLAIPILFILGAIAKAGIASIVIAIIINRIYKEQLKVNIPQFKANEILLAWLYIGSLVFFTAILLLTIFDVLTYGMWIAVILDTIIVLMYLYLVFCLRQLSVTFNLNKRLPIPIVAIMVLLFPITDLVVAVRVIGSDR